MCTAIRFTDKNGNMFFGRNLDWTEGYGQEVVITPRNYLYHSAFLGSRKPKYACIGMAMIAENTPLYFDCGNEVGLAVAGLNFPDTSKYEDGEVKGKTNVAAYEFPLWVAMNFASVDEAEAALKNVAIVAKAPNSKLSVSRLHWLIGDKTRSIVVEYTENGMQVYHNDLDVLTNEPSFDKHLEEYCKSSGNYPAGLPGDWTPSARFLRVAYLSRHYPVQDGEKKNIMRLLHTLEGVAIADGAHVMNNGSFEKTIYTGGFSALSKAYYYNTYDDYTIKKVPMSDFDLTGQNLFLERE